MEPATYAAKNPTLYQPDNWTRHVTFQTSSVNRRRHSGTPGRRRDPPKWQVGKPLATAFRASCLSGLLRVELSSLVLDAAIYCVNHMC
eukprot:3455681-Prymnesium_polylepis.1